MASPTYYEILGLTPQASAAEIKRRYRELARRYHPDVAKTPDAANRFKEINEANRVLSDPERRSLYDAELKLSEMRAEAERRRKVEGEKRRRETPTRRQPPAPARPAPAQRAADTSAQLFASAQQAFLRMRYREAEALCRESLRRGGRNSAAFELLGDIARARGRADEAIAMFSYAIQLDPQNRSVRAKFDRITGQPSGPTLAGHAARAARSGTTSGRHRGYGPRLTPTRGLVTGLGSALLVFLVFFVYNSPNPPATSVRLIDWSAELLFSLAMAGAITGLLLVVNAAIGPARESLMATGGTRRRRFAVPVGAVLLAFSVLSFYAAFAIYAGYGALQGGYSRSVLRAFGAAFLLTMVFALAVQSGMLWVLAVGGNVVFVGLVAGWVIGDLFRQPE